MHRAFLAAAPAFALWACAPEPGDPGVLEIAALGPGSHSRAQIEGSFGEGAGDHGGAILVYDVQLLQGGLLVRHRDGTHHVVFTFDRSDMLEGCKVYHHGRRAKPAELVLTCPE